eukprot:1026067-Amphidinium_carterae.1
MPASKPNEQIDTIESRGLQTRVCHAGCVGLIQTKATLRVGRAYDEWLVIQLPGGNSGGFNFGG